MSKNWQQRLATMAAFCSDGTTPDELDRRIRPLNTTLNGRAVAAAVFTRALKYWPDFYDTDDETPLRCWAQIFDWYPLITPDVADRAVDAVAETIRAPLLPQPGDFINAAQRIMDETA